MKKAYGKWFLTKVKRAIRDYEMIQDGDRVAVGASGGKDSTALLYVLSLLRKHSHLRFEIHAITLDMGLGTDFSPLVEFCARENIPLHIEPTEIGRILFDIRKEANPCSLCSKLRHGTLNDVALRLGCNKVALGHHLDDAIETFLLNIIFTGQLSTFKPSTHLSRTGLTLIRPFIYLPQETVVAVGRYFNLPEIHNPCPAAGHTRRDEMRALVAQLANNYPDVRQKFLTAFQNVDFSNLWKQRRPLPGTEGN